MIHHVALRSRDPLALAIFYEQIFHARRVREQQGFSVWLAMGRVVWMFEKASADQPIPLADSKELLALGVTPQERERVKHDLQQLGIPLESETTWTSYFRDPEGRRLAVSCYDFSPYLEP